MNETHVNQEQDADQVGAVLLRLSGSPESICEQVCAHAVRLLRERLELSRALGPLGRRRP